MVAASSIQPKAEIAVEEATLPMPPKINTVIDKGELILSPEKSPLVIPPEMVVTSPGRIAAAGSTDMFDELRHVVYGSSKNSEIYELIANSSWIRLEQLVKEKPSEAKEWIGEESQEHSEWRRLAIHEACVKLAPYTVIQCLIQANPKGLEEKDHAGRLPLHHAVSYGQSKDVIELLLMEYPESINVVDKWQRTPTMAAEFSTSDSRNDAIELLSKGSKYHNNKKLELAWSRMQDVKEKKVEEKHFGMVQKLKQKLLLAQEESQTDRLALRDEISAYQMFLSEMDWVLGMKRQLRSPLGKKQIRSKDYKTSLDEQVLKLKAHRAEIDEIQVSLKTELEKSASTQRELEHKNNVLSAELQAEINEKRNVNEQLFEKTEEVLSTKSSLTNERKERKMLIEELQESRFSEKALNDEVALLTEQLIEAKGRIGNANKSTKELRIDIDELQASLKDKQAGSASLQASIHEKERVIVSLEEEVAKLSEELEEAMKTYSTLEDHIFKLQNKTGPLTAELKAEKETNSNLLNEVDEMRSNQKEMQSIVSATLSAEASLKTDLAGVVLKVDQMQHEYDTLLEEHKRTKETVKNMVVEGGKLRSQTSGLEEKIIAEAKNHQNEKHAWFESKKELDEAIATLRCETVELKAENEGLAGQVEDSNEKVVQLGQAAQEARVQISKTIATLTAQKKEAEHHTEKLSRAHTQERSELIARMADLEANARSMDRERGNEKIHMVSAFDALEEALNVAATENGKILKQILVSHKRHAGVGPAADEVVRSRHSPRRGKGRFTYVDGGDADFDEY